jgi:hypothetical protein
VGGGGWGVESGRTSWGSEAEKASALCWRRRPTCTRLAAREGWHDSQGHSTTWNQAPLSPHPSRLCTLTALSATSPSASSSHASSQPALKSSRGAAPPWPWEPLRFLLAARPAAAAALRGALKGSPGSSGRGSPLRVPGRGGGGAQAQVQLGGAREAVWEAARQ